MWNVMLKTLDYFLCVSRHDLRYLGPVSPNCPNAQIPVKQVDTRVKTNLVWNVELKMLDYFSCVAAHDLGYLGPISPNCPKIQAPAKEVKLTPQRALTLEEGLICSKIRIWKLWITFHMSLHVIWSIWGQFPQIAPIAEYLCSRYISTHRGPWY